MECFTLDADDAVGNSDARQAAAATECEIPDAGDAVGNSDARQAAAVSKCATRDAGDASPVNSSWNLNRASGISRIVGNRHRRVVGIDLVGIQPKRLSRSVA